jgi:hypothetical protein
MNDKHGVLAGRNDLILELGCGEHRTVPGAVTIDVLDLSAVDVVGDVFEVLSLLPNGSVRAIHSTHFLEHIADLEALLVEFERILKSGGAVVATVPHFSNPYYYSDPTHRTFFGLYTFCYLAHSKLFKRKVPTYGKTRRLEYTGVYLQFRGDHFRYRGALKRALGRLVNLSRGTQEFYEENLVWLFPCYELKLTLTKS